MKDDDQVGEHGQLMHIVYTGSGHSIGDYSSTITANQMNQMVSRSDVKKILANIELVTSVLRVKSSKPRSGKFNIWQRAAKQSNFTCGMIRSMINSLNQSSKMQKTLPKFSDTSLQSYPFEIKKGSNLNGREGNSTSIDTRITIGPDGYSDYVVNIATGEASNSDDSQLIDQQGHGMYKDSRVDLIDLNLPILIQLAQKRQKSEAI